MRDILDRDAAIGESRLVDKSPSRQGLHRCVSDCDPFLAQPTHLRIGATLMLLLFVGPLLQVPRGQEGLEFVYRGDRYVMDPFPVLFGQSPLGKTRKALFDDYLKNSAEGQARVKAAKSTDPEKVWAALHIEEQTTFLAVTAATSALTTEQGTNVLSWLTKLDQIHGSIKPFTGGEYDNNQAYRLYVRLNDSGKAHVLAGSGSFTNACAKRSFDYGGAGSVHPDFCRLPQKFDDENKTDNAPNLQFNVTNATGCADVDLDYDGDHLINHFKKDNSNVLAHNDNGASPQHAHLQAFSKQYCDPGFRK